MSSTKDRLVERTQAYMDKYSGNDRDEFTKAYRRLSAKQIATIYIELPYLLDVYLGGLLMMTKDNPDAFQYIYNNLDRYNNRILIEHAPYFGDLNISETQLLEFLQQPENQLIKMLTAPPTDMWDALKSLHLDYMETNKKKECIDISVVDRLTYVINTWPLQLDEDGIKKLRLKFIIGLGDRNINFGVISTPGWNLNERHYREFDNWFVYHFHHWVDDETTNACKALADMQLENASIYTPPRVSDPETITALHEYTLQDYTNLEKRSLVVMNLRTTFQYYRTKVLSK